MEKNLYWLVITIPSSFLVSVMVQFFKSKRPGDSLNPLHQTIAVPLRPQLSLRPRHTNSTIQQIKSNRFISKKHLYLYLSISTRQRIKS